MTPEFFFLLISTVCSMGFVTCLSLMFNGLLCCFEVWVRLPIFKTFDNQDISLRIVGIQA